MFRLFNISLIVICFVIFTKDASSQIFAGNDTTICQNSSATLSATVTDHPGATVYQFNNIAYTPEAFTGNSISLGDDAVSGALPIGFQFCFIGNNYTQFYIGSNGWISFSPGQPASSYIAQPIPTTNSYVPKNCIMAPWMDWDPGVGGQIFYQTIGTSPSRKLVVSFLNVPLYGSGCNNFQGTFQIVIHEGTNIINNFIQNKPICSGGGAGGSTNATQGVHNIDGTIAYTVPGRNNTQWIATNEGTQFMPTGPALYNVTWHNLSGTQVGSGNTITVNPPITTTYVAKVVYNCSQITLYDTVVVNVAPPIATTTSIVHASCNGATDGSATVNVTGGTSPFTYIWSTAPPQNTATASNLAAGNYIVTVTDAVGCTSMKTVTINQPNPIVANISKIDPSCNGATDGEATANAVGGVSPFTYLWSDGQTTAKAIGLTNGTYTVTITDNTGCEKVVSTTLTGQPPFNITLTTVDPLCNGGTGSITAVTSSGTAPFTYSWSSGATGSTASGLPAGNYTVTITDATGCNNTASTTITSPSAITATATITDANCAGNSDGSISLTVSNGNTPYTYNWSNGTAANPAINLAAGNYSVTITDANGCDLIASYAITEPSAISITTTTTDPTCSGTANGSATATAIGGTAPYSFSWNNGGSTATINNLNAGNYTVTVTDSKGCTEIAQVVLVDASAINANLTVIPINCNGSNDGSAAVNPTGGTGISSINWSNGQSGTTISNLSPGNYSVTVTDNSGCTKIETFSLQDPQPIVLTFSKTNVSCYNGNDGTLSISPANGIPPFTYSWNNGGNSSNLTNLTAGSYLVTVTDSKGCQITTSSILSQPPQIQINIATDSVLCNNEANGSATATVTGGVSPYNFAWSDGQSNSKAMNLAAGNYGLTITDQNNCTEIGTAIIEEPAAFVSSISVTDENCIAEDGTATVTVTGGNTPYSYLWQNGNTSDKATDLAAGNYDVTITDSKGCEHITTATIARTGGISAVPDIKDITCFGFDDGSVTLNITGGTDPLAYNWSHGSYDSSLYNLKPGNYSVTISDIYGCKDSLSIDVTEPPLLTLNFINSADASCFGFDDGFSEVSVAGGIQPYSYFWSTGDSLASASNLTADNYYIIVSDSNGCTISDSIEIKQPEEILIDMMADTTLPYGKRLMLTASVSPSSNYSYSWAPADFLVDMNSSPNPLAEPRISTLFTLTVKDNNTDCIVTDSVFVEVKSPQQFWIATAFSPNDDGINDVHEAKGNDLQYFSMSIYNRWGKLVFSTTDINNSWDGKDKGQTLPAGTYVYKAFIIDEWGIEHSVSGNITLLR